MIMIALMDHCSLQVLLPTAAAGCRQDVITAAALADLALLLLVLRTVVDDFIWKLLSHTEALHPGAA